MQLQIDSSKIKIPILLGLVKRVIKNLDSLLAELVMRLQEDQSGAEPKSHGSRCLKSNIIFNTSHQKSSC
tara:strand:+ start:43 stop:252 length:210 start_codon:yes stop_codon:yes gene_type:complete